MGCASSGPSSVDASHLFVNNYEMMEEIGVGTYASVYRARHMATNKLYAVKVFDTRSYTQRQHDVMQREVSLMGQLSHPNVVYIHEFFDEGDECFLVMELCTGGELFDRLIARTKFSEADARALMKPLVSAVTYCHERGIVHRDLKPENILMANPTSGSPIKVADFGLATVFEDAGTPQLVTRCGTPGYTAPEVVMHRRYGPQVDVWSIGVIMYMLLCGYPPFDFRNHIKLLDEIKNGRFEFDEEGWSDVSDAAKDLITRMLVVSPDDRFTTAQVLAHPWMTATEDLASSKPLPVALKNFRMSNARKKLRAGMHAVLSSVRFRMLAAGATLSPVSPAGGAAGLAIASAVAAAAGQMSSRRASAESVSPASASRPVGPGQSGSGGGGGGGEGPTVGPGTSSPPIKLPSLPDPPPTPGEQPQTQTDPAPSSPTWSRAVRRRGVTEDLSLSRRGFFHSHSSDDTSRGSAAGTGTGTGTGAGGTAKPSPGTPATPAGTPATPAGTTTSSTPGAADPGHQQTPPLAGAGGPDCAETKASVSPTAYSITPSPRHHQRLPRSPPRHHRRGRSRSVDLHPRGVDVNVFHSSFVRDEKGNFLQSRVHRASIAHSPGKPGLVPGAAPPKKRRTSAWKRLRKMFMVAMTVVRFRRTEASMSPKPDSDDDGTDAGAGTGAGVGVGVGTGVGDTASGTEAVDGSGAASAGVDTTLNGSPIVGHTSPLRETTSAAASSTTPGSHKSPVLARRRLTRSPSPDEDSAPQTTADPPQQPPPPALVLDPESIRIGVKSRSELAMVPESSKEDDDDDSEPDTLRRTTSSGT